MAQTISDTTGTAEVARTAALTLNQLGEECQAAGLDILAHFIGVAALEAEDGLREMDAAQKTSNVIETEVQAWADKEMPDTDLKAALK